MKRIRLHGVVGWDIYPATLIAVLDELEGEDVEFHIASPGGYVDDALAIVTAIRAHTGKTRAVIAGLAASAGSWIASACDEVLMGPSSLLMIHGPWTWTQGDAGQLRADADVLDKYAGIMQRTYSRHGYDGDDLLAGGDHWFDAAEALDAKLITGVLEDDPEEDDEDEVEARAQVRATLMNSRRREVPDYELPQDIAARLRGYATRTEESDVKVKNKKPGRLAPLAVATEEVEDLVEDLESLVEGAEDGDDIPAEDIEEVVEDALSMEEDDEDEDEEESAPSATLRERNRVAVITGLQDRGYINANQRDRLIRRGVSANRARAVALELSARQQTRVGAIRGGDGSEKRRTGMVNALVNRGLGRAPESGNEWNGRSLMSMAAACHPDLARQHDGAQLMRAVLQRASGQQYQASSNGISHGTSDFTNVLGDSVNRTMLIGYDEIEDTWSGWTNRAELRDFRPTPRVDLGAFGELAEVPELGEVPSKTLVDRGVNAQLKKYAGRFGISFEALVNDDLSVFTEIPRRKGQAAKRTVANHVYRMIVENTEVIEGAVLFHADHNNLGSEALDSAGLSARRAAMRRQTMPTGGDGDTNEVTHMAPRFLLVPPELYGYALELVSAVLQEGGGTNIWAGSLQILEEPRLTAAGHWFLAASGVEADTVEVGYLQGNDTPMLDNENGWTVYGTEFRVMLPFGVTLRDFRGLQKATGGAPA